jgi:NNMT/PNMT/TEMT family
MVRNVADCEPGMPNRAAPWADFDADAYWKFNYASILPEDAEIIRWASSFLITAFRGRPPVREAVDVGAGTNLYPALLMLPWAERIVFTDYAQTNMGWLRDNLDEARGEWPWKPFWNLLAELPGYDQIAEPRHRLATGYDIRHLSVFELPPQRWELGSMFFVADGITTDQAEFESAVRKFLESLIPGAPFMMAFMEGSTGYDVNGIQFPAVHITLESIRALLGVLPVREASLFRTNKTARPLRLGYDAMVLVTGYVT